MRHGDWHRLIATEGEIFVILTKFAANRLRERPLLYDCQLWATLTTELIKNLVHHLDPADSWPEVEIVLPNGPWGLSMEIHPSLHWRELNQCHFLTNTGWLAGACLEGILPAKCSVCHASCLKLPQQSKKILPEASIIFSHYLLPSKCSWWQLDLVKFSLTSPD